MPHPGDQQRVGLGAIQDPVPVGPADGRKPGVEVVVGPLDCGQHDRWADPTVHDVPQRLELRVGTLGEVEADHLAHGVDAPVGPTGARQLHPGPEDA